MPFVVLKLWYGAVCENLMVLGVCNTGVTLDPLIIFNTKSIQSSWYGDQALPNAYYEKSESGRSYFGFYNNNECFSRNITIDRICMKNYIFIMHSLGEYLTNDLFLCN